LLSVSRRLQFRPGREWNISKKKLMGKTIYDPDPVDFNTRKSFKFEYMDEFDSVKIVNRRDMNGDVVYDVRLVLKTEINRYAAALQITCYLSRNGEWKVKNILTQLLKVIPTWQYRNCIRCKRTEQQIIITNNCDAALLIEGKKLWWSDDGLTQSWRRFEILVKGNSQVSEYANDYKITQIERP
jgi:hypothetical protein